MSLVGMQKKFPTAPPFSLLSLIQSPSKPLRPSINKEEELYRVPSYQTQAADLSLPHHDPPPANFLGVAGDPPPHTATGQQTLGYSRLHPLANHTAGGLFDTFFPGGVGPDETSAGPPYPPPQPDQQYPPDPGLYHHDLYLARLAGYNYEEEHRMYDYHPAPKETGGLVDPAYFQQQPVAPLVQQQPPPPLHPSPAVLLHIKYVMESVCESMCFTDITIVTATDRLRAHRSILTAHSSFLSFLLAGELQESEGLLLFPHFPSLHVRMLLQFFYTGEVTTMTQADIEPLRQICLSLGISSLLTRLDDVKLSISFQHISSGGYDVGCRSQELDEQPTTSCKFQEQREKLKMTGAKSVEFQTTRQYTVVSKMPKNTNLQLNVKCTKCDLKFFKKEQLEEHMKIHAGRKPKECEVCQKTFNTNYHLNTHMRTHTGQKPYSCPLQGCNKEFSDSSAFRRHQGTHQVDKHGKPIKLFNCGVCSKTFTDRSSGKRHEEEHGKKKKFPCSVCAKKFTRRSHLKKHKSSVHSKNNESIDDPENSDNNTTEEKVKHPPHECGVCNAVFRTSSKLAQHLMVHSGEKPHKCDQCDKAFARKTNLQLHMRTHTGEKPHACARCGRCFSDVSAFRRHCRTHSGERPHRCRVCSAAFTQLANTCTY